MCTALGAYRGHLRQRLVVAYLVPDRTDWLDNDCVAAAGWLRVDDPT